MSDQNTTEENFSLEAYLSNAKHKSYIVVIATLIFVMLIFTLGVFPSINAVLKQRENNKNRELTIEKLTKLNNDLANLARERKEKNDTLITFNKAFPTGFNQAEVISTLNKYAENNSVKVISYNFEKYDDEQAIIDKYLVTEKVSAHSITIKCEANGNSFLNFLSELENGVMIFDLTDLEMTTLDSSNNYSIELSLLYFFTDSENV